VSLDYKITTGELQNIFSKLKSGKSPGLDNVSNEMLKASQSYMNPCLLKLFNAVFTSGIYPSKWHYQPNINQICYIILN
jgi:hypothetical protein